MKLFKLINELDDDTLSEQSEEYRFLQNILNNNDCNSLCEIENDQNILFAIVNKYECAPEIFSQIIKLILKISNFPINLKDEQERNIYFYCLEQYLENGTSLSPLNLILDHSELEFFAFTSSYKENNTYHLIGQTLMADRCEQLLYKTLSHPNFKCQSFNRWNNFSVLHEWCKIPHISRDLLKKSFDILKNLKDFDLEILPKYSDQKPLLFEAIQMGNLSIIYCIVEERGAQYVWNKNIQLKNEKYNMAMALASSSALNNDIKFEIFLFLNEEFSHLLEEKFNGKNFIEYLKIKNSDDDQMKKKLNLMMLKKKLNDTIIVNNSRKLKNKL